MEKEIQELVQETVANAFKEIEVSNIRKEVEELRASNKQLVDKLANAEQAPSIPEAKADEITALVEKAIGEKVDTMVGEALEKAIEKVEDVSEIELPKAEVEEKTEVEEETAMTDRQRIKKALTSRRKRAIQKKIAESNAFKPMSRQSVAYTNCSDVEEELEAITETLKNAKTKQDIEQVKKLLQAFITSSKKINNSETLEKEVQDDLSELEAYRALGSIDEIEAAVEVIETYADEIGSLQQLKDTEEKEEALSSKKSLLRRKVLASKRARAIKARREALASKRAEVLKKRTALASRAKTMIARKKATKTRREALASKRAEDLATRRAKALEAKKALFSSKEENKEISASSRIQKIKELKEKRMRLSNIKNRIKENIEISSIDKNTPGAMASALFAKRG